MEVRRDRRADRAVVGQHGMRPNGATLTGSPSRPRVTRRGRAQSREQARSAARMDSGVPRSRAFGQHITYNVICYTLDDPALMSSTWGEAIGTLGLHEQERTDESNHKP